VFRNEVIASPSIVYAQGLTVWSTKPTLLGARVRERHRPALVDDWRVDVNHTDAMAAHDRLSTRVQFDHSGVILTALGTLGVGVVHRLRINQ
jgi:hypothetical protein